MAELFELVRSIFEVIDKAVGLDQPGWRLVSLIVSPLVTLIAFYLNLRGKRQLQHQSEHLGELRERVRTEERLVVARNSEVREKAVEIEKLQRDISLLTERSHELWKIRDAAPFAKQ